MRRARREPRLVRRTKEQLVDPDAFAFFACGLSASSTKSGTMTVRLQYEILLRWKGNHFGSSITSAGIIGTARQEICPYRASKCARE